MMKIIEGDLIQLGLEGQFDAIAHGCNCFSTAPFAGIASQFEKAFQISAYKWEAPSHTGKFNKLGNLDFEMRYIRKSDLKVFNIDQYTMHPLKTEFRDLKVINAYTQYKPGKELNKVALMLCLEKLAFLGKLYNYRIGVPLIGGGIAGGDPVQIKTFMQSYFKDIDATLVVTPEVYKILVPE